MLNSGIGFILLYNGYGDREMNDFVQRLCLELVPVLVPSTLPGVGPDAFFGSDPCCDAIKHFAKRARGTVSFCWYQSGDRA